MAKEFEYVKQIENMTDEEISQRSKSIMLSPLKEKIRAIDYHGEEKEIIEYKYEELIAHCPMTFIIDVYRITLRMVPNSKIPELKSLKFYFWNYQELPISHEHLGAKIYKDFKKAINPKKLYIQLDTAGRGEIFTTIRLGDMDLDNLKNRETKNL
jgi:7-cyano-7-deazaguanine reductase